MFGGTQLVCVPANRHFGLFGHGHRMLLRQQALRCLRGRNSFASLLTGPSVFSGMRIAGFRDSWPCRFAGRQVVCVPANRHFGLFGHGHRMLPRQQDLQCLRGRNSFASLLTGPSAFLGTRIACVPDSRPCGVCGAATRK